MMLYIHIPFCRSKCHYCDFLSFPNGDVFFDSYTDAICRELKIRSLESLDEISSVFIGGGTPSILPIDNILKIFDTINLYYKLSPDIEITMEANPATLDREYARLLKTNTPLNRISIGLQSSNNTLLKNIGRIHNFNDFLEILCHIQAVGFANINVDIMTGLPGQTALDLENTICDISALHPTHISCYALILEEDTKLYKDVECGKTILLDEDEEYNLYKLAINLLESKGYKRYEISNFAKEGFSCKHNLGYWDRLPYIGIGLKAASLINEKRSRNTDNIKKYIDILSQESADYFLYQSEIVAEKTDLSKNDRISEFMFLGLRKINGIIIKDFINSFGYKPEYFYSDILKQLLKEGLIMYNSNNIRLTDRGIDLSNMVLSKFLLD